MFIRSLIAFGNIILLRPLMCPGIQEKSQVLKFLRLSRDPRKISSAEIPQIMGERNKIMFPNAINDLIIMSADPF